MAILLMLIALGPLSVLRGWVFSVLWAWFIVETFHGVPELSLVQAIGIGTIVGLLTVHKTDGDKDPLEDAVEAVIFSVLISLFALGFGWIVHLFMGGAT